MGFRFDGYRRLTFQFNDGWKGEDAHEFIGEFLMLKCRVRPPGDQEACYDEAGERIFTVRAPRGLSSGDIINALQDVFTTACRCEHDCCGHLQTRAGLPRRIKRREWVVEVRCFHNI